MELDSYADLGAQYGTLILHFLADSVHRTLVNTFKATTNQSPFFIDSSWNSNLSVTAGLRIQKSRTYTEQTLQATDSQSEGLTSDKFENYCSRLSKTRQYEEIVIKRSAKLSSTFTIPEEVSSYFSFSLGICRPNRTWWSYVIFALLQGSKAKMSLCLYDDRGPVMI